MSSRCYTCTVSHRIRLAVAMEQRNGRERQRVCYEELREEDDMEVEGADSDDDPH